DVTVDWEIKHWPVVALRQEAMAQKTLLEAADAHVVLIPARHARSLPFHLREWLDRWAALRKLEDAAVAVPDDGRFDHEANPELMRFAKRHRLNFIASELPEQNETGKRLPDFSPERELPFPMALAHVSHETAASSFRGFGINE